MHEQAVEASAVETSAAASAAHGGAEHPEQHNAHSHDDIHRHRAKVEYLLRYDGMIRQQDLECMATIAHLKPLFDRLCFLASSGNKKHSSAEQPHCYYTYPVLLPDSVTVETRHEPLKVLSFQDMSNILQAMDDASTYDNNNDSSLLDVLLTDEQLLLLLRELVNVYHKNNDSHLDKNDFVLSDGLTFPELLQCYRFVVSGIQTLDLFQLSSTQQEPHANASSTSLMLQQQQQLQQLTNQRVLQMIQLFGSSSSSNIEATQQQQQQQQIAGGDADAGAGGTMAATTATQMEHHCSSSIAATMTSRLEQQETIQPSTTIQNKRNISTTGIFCFYICMRYYTNTFRQWNEQQRTITANMKNTKTRRLIIIVVMTVMIIGMGLVVLSLPILSNQFFINNSSTFMTITTTPVTKKTAPKWNHDHDRRRRRRKYGMNMDDTPFSSLDVKKHCQIQIQHELKQQHLKLQTDYERKFNQLTFMNDNECQKQRQTCEFQMKQLTNELTKKMKQDNLAEEEAYHLHYRKQQSNNYYYSGEEQETFKGSLIHSSTSRSEETGLVMGQHDDHNGHHQLLSSPNIKTKKILQKLKRNIIPMVFGSLLSWLIRIVITKFIF